MALIGTINNWGKLQGQINSANGIVTGVISNAGLMGGQVVGMRGVKGDKGDTGDNGTDGVGITSIAKTGTVGLVDTYTITFDDGDTTTFEVTNGQDGVDGIDGDDGVGISSISKTSSAGKIDTYTITYTDGDTDTFTVTNGNDGTNGQDGHSPVVTASKAGKVTTISVDGTPIATINDGQDGVVQDVTVNGTSVLDGTTAKVLVPTDTGDLTNGAGYLDKSGILDLFYPIGSYYETSDSTFDPNVTWGGTWVLETEGQVHVSASDPEDVDPTYPIGDTGGSATVKLTSAESGQKAVTISSSGGHTHTVTSYYRSTASYGSGSAARPYTSSGSSSSTDWASIASDTGKHTHSISGSDATNPHENMPPYIVVNRWHRTA